MATAKDLLNEARKHIGYTEGANNANKFGRWYGMDNQPWCDMFIAYCADQVGALEVVGRFAYTPSHANWFRARGQWHDGPAGAQPGDIVFFKWSKNRIHHVGIVESASGNTLRTVEGNTSNRVLRRTRKSGIVGYGRPAWGPQWGYWTADHHVVGPGASGERVAKIQHNMNRIAGNYPPAGLHTIEADGVYGPKTTAAWKAIELLGYEAVGGKKSEADGTWSTGWDRRLMELLYHRKLVWDGQKFVKAPEPQPEPEPEPKPEPSGDLGKRVKTLETKLVEARQHNNRQDQQIAALSGRVSEAGGILADVGGE